MSRREVAHGDEAGGVGLSQTPLHVQHDFLMVACVPQNGPMSPVDRVQGIPSPWHGDSSVQPLPLGGLSTPV